MKNAVHLSDATAHTDITRDWAARLTHDVPEASVALAENEAAAAEKIATEDGAFGWMPGPLLARAGKLR